MAIPVLEISPVCPPRPSEEQLPSARLVNASKHPGEGNGKSKRFAEIIAVMASAGEISRP
jgi:hypothetical protein